VNALLVVSALLLAGLTVETLCRRRDRRNWSAPGQLVDVGGHRLHARSWGAGPLVLLFEADEGAWSTHWGTLPERFAQDARVVVYDRAGLGWSQPGPPPRDAETLARELHQLLRKLVPEAGRKALIVAHGTGVHVARMYAHRYPFETSGLVFVDGHPDTLADRLRREQVRAPIPPRWLATLGRALTRVGLLRLLALRGTSNSALPLSERQQRLLDALELDPRVQRGASDELAAEERTLEQVGRLRDESTIPTRVLVSGATLSEDRVPRTFPRADYNRLWAEEGQRLGRGSTRAEVTLVEDADHLLQLRSPELVEAAIRGVLAATAHDDTRAVTPLR
jgi:pimeloyl-ACP methyl ester carboxylesterase